MAPASICRCLTALMIGMAAVSSVIAQDAFVPALELLPESSAGLVQIPDLPALCDQAEQTLFGKLLNDPVMEPFLTAQKEQARSYLESLNNRVGLKPEDLYEVASGEVVFAWLSYPKDKRRPFGVGVIADIRNRQQQSEQALAKIDKELRAEGMTAEEKTYAGQTLHVYKRKRRPGQLKIEEIVIVQTNTRMIAADRESLVTGILDAVAAGGLDQSIGSSERYATIQQRCQGLIGDHAPVAHWYARPFEMGRILRELFDVDRGNQVDILNLLQNQGFDVIESAGGTLAMGSGPFDLLHRGYVHAPGPKDDSPRFKLASGMLPASARPIEAIPAWVDESTASFNRLHWNLGDAFWASETLVNEAMGDDLFDSIIEGIRDDEEGPQIDLEKIFKQVDNEVLVITDNVLPATVDAERMLVAIQLKDADVKDAVRRVMEGEPDAKKIETLHGVDIWGVQPGSSDSESGEDFELEFGFGDEEEETEKQPPLLNQWAIAVVDATPITGVPYLLFASHPEFLIDTIKRMHSKGKSLADVTAVKRVYDALQTLQIETSTFDRVMELSKTLRVKYELLRKGELKDSNSVLATMLRRIAEENQGKEPEPINGGKLPPLAAIEKYFSAGGTAVTATDDGWELAGFLLKEDNGVPNQDE
ncbi:MAG: membrane or secreted protein [Planctomycetota bacterium]